MSTKPPFQVSVLGMSGDAWLHVAHSRSSNPVLVKGKSLVVVGEWVEARSGKVFDVIVEDRITKRQSKEIANILNHVRQTTAGQSFKAPVQQLWPECAGAYAAKVSNPIDLGTIQLKVKNNIYPSVNDFRADVVLLYQNSVDFNGVDHIITSTALEVRDTILRALDDIEEGKSSMILRASARVTGA